MLWFRAFCDKTLCLFAVKNNVELLEPEYRAWFITAVAECQMEIGRMTLRTQPYYTLTGRTK